jgi:glycine/D-amino acid oxidase-like deaminating enzyme
MCLRAGHGWTAFPDVIGSRVEPTRQEVIYFGTPAGDERFIESRLPVWVDAGDCLIYGIPGISTAGSKSLTTREGRRSIQPTAIAHHRRYRALASRVREPSFSGAADAPVLGAEVCQYENTPDGHFVIDRHPAMPDVWIAGGGSGHGFKMGPAVGKLLARQVREDASPDPFFALARLQ